MELPENTAIDSKRDYILNGNLNSLLVKFSVPAMVAMVVNALAYCAATDAKNAFFSAVL